MRRSTTALRAHIIDAEPELRGRAGYHEFERVLADAIGQDLGQPGTALAPCLAALAAVTGLRELYDSDEATALASPPEAAGRLALVDRVISCTRAGVDASAVAPARRPKDAGGGRKPRSRPSASGWDSP